MNLDWMAWTVPTAIFFVSIASLLVVFTVLDIVSPSHKRRGMLGMATTRGDRLFLGLLGAAFVMTFWLALASGSALGGALLAGIWFLAALRWA